MWEASSILGALCGGEMLLRIRFPPGEEGMYESVMKVGRMGQQQAVREEAGGTES